MSISKIGLKNTTKYSKFQSSVCSDEPKINSVISESKKKKTPTNPLSESNQARINYLQNALREAVNTNNRLRSAYRNFRSKLSGMIKISSTQQADLISKRIAYGKSDMNEDIIRSSLMDALHSQAIHYNA